MIKSARDFFTEHWGQVLFVLLLVFMITLGIIAFLPLKDKIVETVLYIILCCAFITGIVYFIGFCLFPLFLCEHDQQRLKVTILIYIFLFFISSIVLSQLVFVKEIEYQEQVPHEVKDTMCYITDTGDCYHKSYCGYLYSKIPITISSAKAQGYEPCTFCWDSDYSIEYQTETLSRTEHNYVLSYILSSALWLGIFVITLLMYKRKEVIPVSNTPTEQVK